MNVPSYPKILTVGNMYAKDLFTGEVEITEKVDGSFFGFGIDKDSNIVMRSKGQELFFDSNQKMFSNAIAYVDTKREVLLTKFAPGTYFYGEYLQSPHHNVLTYDRTPRNHIILFGVLRESEGWDNYEQLCKDAELLDLEVVPLIYKGTMESDYEKLKGLIGQTKSILGKEVIEGIVVKNYNQTIMLGSQLFPVFGKFVRESFKEKLDKEWGPRHSQADKVEVFLNSFKTEARWQKAIQHLRDDGKLLNDPKDIGILLKEIERDLIDEEKADIGIKLYHLFIDQILRKTKAGFPEFYKEQLVKEALGAIK